MWEWIHYTTYKKTEFRALQTDEYNSFNNTRDIKLDLITLLNMSEGVIYGK